MRTKHTLVLALFVSLFVLAGSPPEPVARGAESGLVLVVAKGNPIGNLTKAELNRTFSGEAIKIDGQSVVPFALATGLPERRAFDQIVLGMSPDEVSKYWIDRRIRGQGNPPKSAPSPDVMAKAVASFPSAMGYLPVANLTAGLKPVSIDGRAYTDHGYLLSQAR